MTDLKHPFESSAADEPPHRDIHTRLALGERAQRRRRLTAGAGALAFAAVLVGGGFAVQSLTGGSDDAQRGTDASTQVAGNGATSAAKGPEQTKSEDWGNCPIRFTEDGSVEAKDKYTIVSAEYDVDPKAKRSAAVELSSADGAENRYAGLAEKKGATECSDMATRAAASAVDWYRITMMGQMLADDDLVAFGEDGRLRSINPAVKVLEQRTDVDLTDSFAGPGDATAVARLEIAGKQTYLSARMIAGERSGEYFPIYNNDFPDLDAFVADQRAAMQGGEGNR